MRWYRHGALLRHVPELLVPTPHREPDPRPSIRDEVRFVANHLGRTWALWAAFRGLVTRTISLRHLSAVRQGLANPRPPSQTFGLSSPNDSPDPEARVTVLVPTVGRYPYLEPLLQQIQEQTVAPHQIIVVDQNLRLSATTFKPSRPAHRSRSTISSHRVSARPEIWGCNMPRAHTCSSSTTTTKSHRTSSSSTCGSSLQPK